MIQQRHSYTYIQRKLWLEKIHEPIVHSSATYSSQYMEAT